MKVLNEFTATMQQPSYIIQDIHGPSIQVEEPVCGQNGLAGFLHAIVLFMKLSNQKLVMLFN
ncbi:hypothetical protein JHK82_057380 [Glycine max]|uniref:Uncharacterized protein n=2 Tax=Glycine subgen. Soja TaxID=1462606 RepID=A0A0R0EQK9_SOYBN|nr:hypothetical protein JHK86_057213 [Glycine max]KAG4998824.1 hypothetical protein JHK87_019896 [Glycine soja]KAG4919957.1 hypothetical protein JHK85_058238 [Glycine max]KAG5076040.1 hypothetical protein JHK84_057271 [Glycine max]KAG5078685.1 hypothetical protein JHK82_057380 [Glycine max]